jgi:small subunit ribosomal protein S3Ae
MVIKKSKTKQWFRVIAPEMFESTELAKTMAVDPESLVNRKVGLSVMELTNDYGKFYMKFFFRIKRVEGDKAFSDFDGTEVMRDYIARMVIRRVRRIDTVQDLTTKDGIKITVKGLAVISKKINSNVAKTMRVKIKEMIKSEVESSTLEEVVGMILGDDLKRKVMSEVREIYPIRNFEVRKTQIIAQ